MTQEQTVYGMSESERLKQVNGIKTIPYYDRRGDGYNAPEEVSIPLTVEEIDTIGKAIQQWAPRVSLLADLGKALGVETGKAEEQMVKVLHYRLAHAAHMLDAERFPDPIGNLADKPQEEPVPEAVNEETVPAEVDPDPLVLDENDLIANVPGEHPMDFGAGRPDPDSVTGIDVEEDEVPEEEAGQPLPS